MEYFVIGDDDTVLGFSVRETVDHYLFSESFPLVVEIPSPGQAFKRDLRSLVNQAIGVSI